MLTIKPYCARLTTKPRRYGTIGPFECDYDGKGTHHLKLWVEHLGPDWKRKFDKPHQFADAYAKGIINEAMFVIWGVRPWQKGTWRKKPEEFSKYGQMWKIKKIRLCARGVEMRKWMWDEASGSLTFRHKSPSLGQVPK